MRQGWDDLLFAHWPVAYAALRPLVPPALTLETHDGSAWVGVVPFSMRRVRLLPLPELPGLSSFGELNVRTYVTDGARPGVYFFSLDASNLPAVVAARIGFHLPYFHARMRATTIGDETRYASARYGCRLARFRARYRPIGPPQPAPPGTLAYFLTERYCLYTTNRRGALLRVEIQHPPWPLQPAEAEIEVNGMAAAAGIALPDTAPLLHVSRRQDMVNWLIERA
jgi:uncharacterized protein YqjF (DUF2071 family)